MKKKYEGDLCVGEDDQDGLCVGEDNHDGGLSVGEDDLAAQLTLSSALSVAKYFPQPLI